MRVTIDATELMQQAAMTAKQYLISARHDINELFGNEYAEAHPELMCAYMQTAALDYLAAQVNVAGHAVADAIDGVACEIMESTKDDS